jgi:hypothetical protein
MQRSWMMGLVCTMALASCEGGGEASALADSSLALVAAQGAAPPQCRADGQSAVLPDEVRESSGLAQSRRDPALLWTHNDAGNGAEIFALDASGALAQRVRIAGAEATDWEDIESGACETGDCLYIGDIGDNDAERSRITIYRIDEPSAGAAESGTAVALHARFAEGPRDAEGLFALPSGDLYVVTKGRTGPVELYRFPSPQVPGETATLERVRELFPAPGHDDDRVTAATASPDGRWVAVRSYRNLYLYRADDLVGGGEADPTVIDLSPLGQAQGESVVIAADGTVWLTTEAENKEARPRWTRLQCTFPAG